MLINFNINMILRIFKSYLIINSILKILRKLKIVKSLDEFKIMIKIFKLYNILWFVRLVVDVLIFCIMLFSIINV